MRALVLWCTVWKIFDDKNALQDAQYSKNWKKYSASWSVVLSSNIFWMLHHKTSTSIFFKQREQTENLKQWSHIHIYLVIIFVLFLPFLGTLWDDGLFCQRSFWLSVGEPSTQYLFIKESTTCFWCHHMTFTLKLSDQRKKKCPKLSFFCVLNKKF